MMENRDFYDIWEEKLDELFKELGIRCGTKGEEYLRELVAWYRPVKYMQECLAEVGAVLGASPATVERVARQAILSARQRLGFSFEVWDRLFGRAMNPGTGAPSLSEFVVRVRREVCGRNT